MFFRKAIYFSLIFLLILNLIFLGIILHFKNNDLKVAFLDVGQGDAILIAQGQNQILIDGGKSEEKLLEGLGKHIPFWDRKIEVMLATHPDQDHIGGLSQLPEKYEIGSLISTKAQSNSNVFRIFQNSYEKNSIQKIEGKFGVKVKMEGGELEIIYPFKNLSKKVYKDTNATSLVGRLVFGKDNFLLTGDIGKTQEAELLKNNINVSAEYLKVAHHGSKHSSSQEFLERVGPRWGIISAGKNNRYGHPAEEVIKRLKSNNIEILRTDEEGDVTFVCNQNSQSCQRED